MKWRIVERVAVRVLVVVLTALVALLEGRVTELAAEVGHVERQVEAVISE